MKASKILEISVSYEDEGEGFSGRCRDGGMCSKIQLEGIGAVSRKQKPPASWCKPTRKGSLIGGTRLALGGLKKNKLSQGGGPKTEGNDRNLRVKGSAGSNGCKRR